MSWPNVMTRPQSLSQSRLSCFGVEDFCWLELLPCGWSSAICIYIYSFLVPETSILKWLFDETAISQVKVWNDPTETTIKQWLFRVDI